MEIYFRYRQISTNTPRSARSIKDKSGEFVFLFSFPFFKCELAFILTRLEAPRRLRRSRKKASQNSPAVPKFKKRGIATSIMFSPAAMISEALSVNWTPAATKTEVDCDFSFYILLLPTDKKHKRLHTPAKRGSCGLSFKSIWLRSCQTTPLSTLRRC